MVLSDLNFETRNKVAKLPTPFFLFDLDRIAANIQRLKAAIKPDRLMYAVKSNSLQPVLETVATQECAFEVNTRGEWKKVLEVVPNIENGINSAPIKSAADIEEMYAAGIRCFAFDCHDEVDKLKALAPNAEVLLRLTTSNEGSEWHLNEKFGVSPSEASTLLSYARDAGLLLRGITFHVGSQCPNIENWHDGIRESAVLFRQFPEMNTLDIGGGFPVHYHEDVPSFEDIGQTIHEALAAHFEKRPALWIEPGRAIAGDAAITGTTVTAVKHKSPLSWAYVDMSIFGGLLEIIEDKNRFEYSVEYKSDGPERTYNIGGASCDGLDLLSEKIRLADLKRDDRLYFLNTGAYSIEYAAAFNGIEIPRVYWIKEGELL